MQSQCCCSDTYFHSLQFLNLMARKMKVSTADAYYQSWLLLVYLKRRRTHLTGLIVARSGASRVSAMQQAPRRCCCDLTRCPAIWA